MFFLTNLRRFTQNHQSIVRKNIVYEEMNEIHLSADLLDGHFNGDICTEKLGILWDVHSVIRPICPVRWTFYTTLKYNIHVVCIILRTHVHCIFYTVNCTYELFINLIAQELLVLCTNYKTNYAFCTHHARQHKISSCYFVYDIIHKYIWKLNELIIWTMNAFSSHSISEIQWNMWY